MDEKIENKNKTFEEKIKLSPFIANWLKRQLDIWTDKGILDQAQKDNITDLYIYIFCQNKKLFLYQKKNHP